MKKTVFALASGLLIAGCGGGGGGGGSIPTVPFTSWNNIRPNTTTVVPGSSQEIAYTANASTDTVTSLSSVSPNQSGASYFVTTNANNDTVAIGFRTAQGTTATFSSANGSTLNSRVRYFQTPQQYARFTGAITGDGSSVALAGDERYSGWNYQSFGVWITGRGTGSGTAGAASIGAASLGSNIPSIGTGTFNGSSAGLYVDPQGNYLVTTAYMRANVSFANRTVNFITSDTAAATPNTLLSGSFGTLVPALNLVGTLSYSAGTNRLTGAVSTAGSSTGTPMTGSITGTFYGPAASEIGGTFSTNGTGIETFAGAFGGKR
jgi:hypothetical protein